MKKLFTIIILTMSLAFVLAIPKANVLAQAGGPGTCFDPSGNPIPCPPTDTPEEDDDDDSGGSGGNRNPTNTPLPLVNPTSDGELEGSVTCAGGADASWMLNCITDLVNSCGKAGGSSTIDPPDSAGGVTVNCSVDYLIIDPTLPLVAFPPTPTPLPDENYLGSCSNADGDVFDCFDRYTCEDGLLVIKVDLYAPGGTKYDFYCIPDEVVPQLDLPLSMPKPVGEDNNWTGGCSGGDGLEACLDLMAAGCAEDGGEFSVWYDDDGAGVYCQNQSEAQVAPTATALVLAVPDNDVSPEPSSLPALGLGALIGIIAAVAIPAFMKNARKAKTAEAVTNVKKMYDGARNTDEE